MGSSSILAYLGQLLNGQQACYRMKLMFVGQENVGYLDLCRVVCRVSCVIVWCVIVCRVCRLTSLWFALF